MTSYEEHQHEFNERIAEEMRRAIDAHQDHILVEANNHDVQSHESWLSSAAHVLGHLAAEVTGEVAGQLASDIVLGSHNHSADEHRHPIHIGEPNGNGWHHQENDGHCAVACQKMIMDRFGITNPDSGKSWSEQELVDEAKAHGWFHEKGTSLRDFGKLLESQGIDCHVGHTWPSLIHDLAEGNQVAIAVRAEEVVGESDFMSFIREILPGHPDHAVILRGMETDTHGNVSVIINDPDLEHGAGVRIPVERFQSALGGWLFQYIATNDSPSEYEAQSHDVAPDASEPPFNSLSDDDRNSLLKDN